MAYNPFIPSSPAELVAKAHPVLASTSDATMMQPWTLRQGVKLFFTMPKVAVLRSIVMNQMIHLRAQLGVYLRLSDAPVPPTYAPSADEGQM